MIKEAGSESEDDLRQTLKRLTQVTKSSMGEYFQEYEGLLDDNREVDLNLMNHC